MLKLNIVAAAVFVSQAVLAHAQSAELHKVPGQLYAENAVADRAAASPNVGQLGTNKDPGIDRVASRVADPAPALLGFSRADIPQQSQPGAVGKGMGDPAGRAEAWNELSRIVNTGGTN